MHFDSCHVYIFYIQLFQKRIKIQINICRNTFYKERVHVYMCGFLTSSILIDEVSNYTGVILRIACFDLNCPLFTYLDFWHRLSSIVLATRRWTLHSPYGTHHNHNMSIIMRKPVYAMMQTTKTADQPAHLRSLISAFVVRSQDSIIAILSKSKVSGF